MVKMVEFPKCAVCNSSDDVRRCQLCDDWVCVEFAFQTGIHLGPDNMDMDPYCDHEHSVLTGDGWDAFIDEGPSVPPEGVSGLRRSLTRRSVGGHSSGRYRNGTRPAVHGAVGQLHGFDTSDQWLAAFEMLCDQLDMLVEQRAKSGGDLAMQRATRFGIARLRATLDNLVGANRYFAVDRARPTD